MKGIKDQIQECKLEDYNNLTLDELTNLINFVMEITNKSQASERKIYVNKKNYIDFRYSLGKTVGLNEEELKALVDKLEKELPEELYEL